MKIVVRATAFVFVLVLCGGCGRHTDRPRVEGKVTLNGTPVAEQTLVLFHEENGELFSQALPIRADGAFSGEVPKVGTYKIVIEKSQAAQEGKRLKGADKMTVPLKYRNRATTDMTWKIESGWNRRDIQLKE